MVDCRAARPGGRRRADPACARGRGRPERPAARAAARAAPAWGGPLVSSRGSGQFAVRDPDGVVRAAVETFLEELDVARPGATHTFADVVRSLLVMSVADPGMRLRFGLGPHGPAAASAPLRPPRRRPGRLGGARF